MPGSSSWMSCAPQGVKGFDDDEMMFTVLQFFHSNELNGIQMQICMVQCCVIPDTCQICLLIHTHTQNSLHLQVFVAVNDIGRVHSALSTLESVSTPTSVT